MGDVDSAFDRGTPHRSAGLPLGASVSRAVFGPSYEVVNEQCNVGELRVGDFVIWEGAVKRVAQISDPVEMSGSVHPLIPVRFGTPISHATAFWRGHKITRILIEEKH